MRPDQAIEFLKALGGTHIADRGNGWVVSSCILARFTHKSGTDTNPSFAIRAVEGDRAFFNCYSCRKGSAEELIQALELYTKGSPYAKQYNFKAARALLDEENIVVPLPEYSEFGPQAGAFEEWPMYWLESFKPVDFFPAAMQYLKSRNVPQETIQKHGLVFDTSRSMIVAPYWNVFGRLAGARGRCILPGVEGFKKHYDYTCNGVNNSKSVWYNEQSLDLPGPAVGVEGQFDTWRVEQRWPKVVGNLTALPTYEKMRKICDCGVFIHLSDNDAAGIQSRVAYAKMCAMLKIDYRPVNYGDSSVKDPDMCSPNYLYDRIMAHAE